MSINFTVLGSSSSDNYALIPVSYTRVLIDANFSRNRIVKYLEKIDTPAKTLDAIFITHEHSEHATRLRELLKYPNIQFFTNQNTLQPPQRQISRPRNWNTFDSRSSFNYKNLTVGAFSIPNPNDAYGPAVGYHFKYTNEAYGDYKSLAWGTYLGFPPKLVQEKIRHKDILIFQCNYDLNLLDADERRAGSIKLRINSRHSHLSNQDAFNFLIITPNSWKKVYLTDLSKGCNDPRCTESLCSPLSTDSNGFEINIIAPAEALESILIFI